MKNKMPAKRKLNASAIMIWSLLVTDFGRAELLQVEPAAAIIPPEVEPLRDSVIDCGLNLLEASGKSVDSEAVASLPAMYREASLTKDEEFLEYMLSVIYVESRFDRRAISPMDARGLMQMTSIAVRDAVGSCSLRPLGDISKLHDSHTNVKYGSCYLKKLNTEMNGDWTRTLIAYNGGYAQLIKYDKGLEIATETANYVLKVNRALNSICKQPRTERQ